MGETRRDWGPRLLLATVIVALFVVANVNGKHPQLWMSIFLTMFAATLAASSIDSIRRGHTLGRPFSADRVREPKWFWGHVIFHFVLVAWCLLVLLMIWRTEPQ
jgi:hypothetical protein